MKAKKESLQELTETEKKINEILSKPKVEKSDLKQLGDDELRPFLNKMKQQINELKGESFDKFYEKVEELLIPDVKNQIWERNHNQITWSISILMQEYGRMPSVGEIATKSELSRQTIHKHLKEYAKDPRFLEIMDKFQFMTSKVLARVFKFAVDGDMKAAKLYFNVLGNLSIHTSTGFINNTQNNYIQINGTILSQESLKLLNPDQLQVIEAIVKTTLPT